jgi:hypothetical protein
MRVKDGWLARLVKIGGVISGFKANYPAHYVSRDYQIQNGKVIEWRNSSRQLASSGVRLFA